MWVAALVYRALFILVVGCGIAELLNAWTWDVWKLCLGGTILSFVLNTLLIALGVE